MHLVPGFKHQLWFNSMTSVSREHAMASTNTADTQAVNAIFRATLGRDADPQGLEHWLKVYRDHNSLEPVLAGILASAERRSRTPALHAARVEMVRQLPRARRIVDLGGGALNDPRGALVVMGYPYQFESLSIIEPPYDDRHDIYKDIPDRLTEVKTSQGLVKYVYSSMANLSSIPSGSIDLVFSGETIEHVSLADCRKTLREVKRVLTPEGSFCFDTPNRAVTKIQCPNSFINPDHKIEYTHSEMSALLADAGLHIQETKGITYMPKTLSTAKYWEDEMVDNVGMYDDFAACYLLYYRCRPV